MTFNCRIDPLGVNDGGIQALGAVSFAPVMNARWQNDGAALQPIPQTRGATPSTIPIGATDRTFTIDHSGLSPALLELSILVTDSNGPASDGPLWRSGLLTALPSAPSGSAVPFITIVFANPDTQTVTTANSMIAARFAGGPIATTDPAVTLTGASIAANPNRPTSWLLTAFGTYTGALPPLAPPGLGSLFFRYSGEVTFGPATDPWNTTPIATCSISAPGVVFTDAPGGGTVVTALDGLATWFLNAVSPFVAETMREQVETTLAGIIDQSIRNQVSVALGVPRNAGGTPGPLPAGVTVSLQRITISGSTLTGFATVGTFGGISVAGSGAGCAFPTFVILGMAAATATWLSG